MSGDRTGNGRAAGRASILATATTVLARIGHSRTGSAVRDTGTELAGEGLRGQIAD